MKLDYLVVGQGLAGTLFSYQLLKRNKKIKVINQQKKETASQVAAGIFNPVTGRNMVKTWKADLLFPYIEICYRELEQTIGKKVLYKKTIYRPFHHVEEQNDWMGKASNKEFSSYVDNVSFKSEHKDFAHDAMGGISLRQSGYVDVQTLIEGYRQYLIQTDNYIEAEFDENALLIDTDGVKYGQYFARKIIFCEGPEVSSNPYFNWLPFRPVKGEILYIHPEKDFQIIYNRGVFVLPLHDGKYKVGSTYHHHDLSYNITADARRYLCEKLETLLNMKYTVTGQIAGIRPATKDRRPIIGLHPEYNVLGIFNGMGAKGVSLAPYFANQFAGNLEGQSELDSEVNVQRFVSYFKSAAIK